MGAIQPRVPCGWDHRCLGERHRRQGLYAGPADPPPVERWEELTILVAQKDDETSALGRITDITGSIRHNIEPFSSSHRA
jgi:hypothetical protein